MVGFITPGVEEANEMSDERTVQSSLGEEPREVSREELVVSAHEGRNAELFPNVLDLHVPVGSKIADVTYGKGVFWKQVPQGAYDVYGSDLDSEKSPTGESVDC